MKKCFLLIPLTFFWACKPEKVKVPSDIIQPAQMTRVLMDMHIAEAKTLQTKAIGDTSYQVYLNFRNQAFAKHKLDTATFNRSFRWYTAHAQVLDKAYQDAVDSLGLRSEKGIWD